VKTSFKPLLILGLAACNQQPNWPEGLPESTNTLEGSVGTYNHNGGNLGTSVFLKIRGLDGKPPSNHLLVKISGPAGWNADQSKLIVYPANSNWRGIGLARIAPVTGSYSISTSIGGKIYAATVRLEDPTDRVGSPTLIVEATAFEVGLSWAQPPGAHTCTARILEEEPRGNYRTSPVLPASTTGYTFTGLNLDPLKQNWATLFCHNFDISSKSPTFPKQANTAYSWQVIPIAAALSRQFQAQVQHERDVYDFAQ
jgi:hypothetical protein